MNGILVLNKPGGISSYKAVIMAKKAFNTKKIGHTGTLDPMAEGVLPLLVGNATKAAEFLIEKDKKYRATILLGITTDTLDITGTVTEEKKVEVNEKEIKETIKSFVGDIFQVPPMYSAISVNGQRLYKMARKGIEVKREKRKVTIYSIDIVKIDIPEIVIDVSSSKGTYIRSLSDDIGKKLGCGATLTRLIRQESGRFFLKDAISPDEMFLRQQEGTLEKSLIPVDVLFSDFERIDLNSDASKRVKNGVPIYFKKAEIGKMYRLYDQNGKFIAVSRGEITDEKNSLKLVRGFFDGE